MCKMLNCNVTDMNVLNKELFPQLRSGWLKDMPHRQEVSTFTFHFPEYTCTNHVYVID